MVECHYDLKTPNFQIICIMVGTREHAMRLPRPVP